MLTIDMLNGCVFFRDGEDKLVGFRFRYKDDGQQLREDIILAVTQLGCFPFAVDINDDLLAEIQM